MQTFNLQISYSVHISIFSEEEDRIYGLQELTDEDKEQIRNKLRTYRRRTNGSILLELTEEQLTTQFATHDFGVVHINNEDIQFSSYPNYDCINININIDVVADEDMEFLIEETEEMIYYYDFPEPRKKQETVKTFIPNSCLLAHYEQEIQIDASNGTRLSIQNVSNYENVQFEIVEPSFEYVLK
jgi:hypothetical protein